MCPGLDQETRIVRAMDEAELVIIMGSESYGKETQSAYSTFNELRFVTDKENEKIEKIFLIKMCKRFSEGMYLRLRHKIRTF